MKQYGANKATEFTKKQINVIWAKAKNGELKVEKWFLSECYNLAEYYGYDYNGSVARDEASILIILEAVFSGDFEKAQAEINWLADSWYSCFSSKKAAQCDRTVYVA